MTGHTSELNMTDSCTVKIDDKGLVNQYKSISETMKPDAFSSLVLDVSDYNNFGMPDLQCYLSLSKTGEAIGIDVALSGLGENAERLVRQSSQSNIQTQGA